MAYICSKIQGGKWVQMQGLSNHKISWPEKHAKLLPLGLSIRTTVPPGPSQSSGTLAFRFTTMGLCSSPVNGSFSLGNFNNCGFVLNVSMNLTIELGFVLCGKTPTLLLYAAGWVSFCNPLAFSSTLLRKGKTNYVSFPNSKLCSYFKVHQYWNYNNPTAEHYGTCGEGFLPWISVSKSVNNQTCIFLPLVARETWERNILSSLVTLLTALKVDVWSFLLFSSISSCLHSQSYSCFATTPSLCKWVLSSSVRAA